MNAEVNRRILERWMLDGVTVVDPATTWIEATSIGGRRHHLAEHPAAGRHLGGHRAVIGPDTTHATSRVGENATSSAPTVSCR
jgi:bifunctional UDP-N-acetylglucosamine pyrophosphorylase/glucosamine-1-phosphate N-acetyltransferase